MKSWMTVVAAAVFLAGCNASKAPEDYRGVSLGLGSVLETRTVTTLANVKVRDEVTTTRHKMVGRTESEASLALETKNGDGTSATAELTVPMTVATPNQDECPGMVVRSVTASCSVPAGTFDCTKTTTEYQQGDVLRTVETWTAPGVPVPLRSVVTNESLTTVTELIRLSAQ